MEKQKKLFQMKKQDKPQREKKKTLNEMDISNLPDKEFKLTVITMLTGKKLSRWQMVEE